MSKPTDKEIHILKQTMGFERSQDFLGKTLYPNYYVAGKEWSEYPLLESLVLKGLMIKEKNYLDKINGTFIFSVSLEGVELLEKIKTLDKK